MSPKPKPALPENLNDHVVRITLTEVMMVKPGRVDGKNTLQPEVVNAAEVQVEVTDDKGRPRWAPGLGGPLVAVGNQVGCTYAELLHALARVLEAHGEKGAGE